MSWPHILSFSRVVAGPVVAALIVATPGDAYLLAAILFVLASLTDLVDGKLARYAQRVSPLGIFLDTTADKVLVSLTLVAMAVAGLSALWVPLVIIGREFLISGLRSYAASQGQVISSHSWGKGKTLLTMTAIPLILAIASGRAGGALAPLFSHPSWSVGYTVAEWLLWAAAALTILSGVRYVRDARPLFHLHPTAEPAVPDDTRALGGD